MRRRSPTEIPSSPHITPTTRQLARNWRAPDFRTELGWPNQSPGTRVESKETPWHEIQAARRRR